jgi:three-Cys-motif partner protein
VEPDDERFARLCAATADYSLPTVLNLKGTFSECLPTILEHIGSCPPLFFLDPFGYKGIEWETMLGLAKRPPEAKTELLINFNVRVVDRDACWLNLLGVEPAALTILGNITCLMGTDKWLQGFDPLAPQDDRWHYLTRFYMLQLEQLLGGRRVSHPTRHEDIVRGYAASYPVRTLGGRVKYHLIFVTWHPAGRVAMSDVIYRVDEHYRAEYRKHPYRKVEQKAMQAGQGSLWQAEELLPTQLLEAREDQRIAAELLPDILAEVRTCRTISFGALQERLAAGRWFGNAVEKHYRSAVRILEKDGKVQLDPSRKVDDQTILHFTEHSSVEPQGRTAAGTASAGPSEYDPPHTGGGGAPSWEA